MHFFFFKHTQINLGKIVRKMKDDASIGTKENIAQPERIEEILAR